MGLFSVDFSLILVYFGLFVAGIGFTIVIQRFIKRQAYVLHQSERGIKGQEVKAEQSVRLIAFLGELKLAYDQAAIDGQQIDLKKFAVEKALPICLKYPDVIAKNGRALLKALNLGGDGKNEIGGLLEGLL